MVAAVNTRHGYDWHIGRKIRAVGLQPKEEIRSTRARDGKYGLIQSSIVSRNDRNIAGSDYCLAS